MVFSLPNLDTQTIRPQNNQKQCCHLLGAFAAPLLIFMLVKFSIRRAAEMMTPFIAGHSSRIRRS